MSRSRIAILGAGPIGMEAALEGARRGHDVSVYEAGRVGDHLLRFDWVRLFTPFAACSTSWGRRRLGETGAALPADEAPLTAGDLVRRYLEPLARLPELEGRIHERSRVTAVGREGLRKGDGIVATGDRARVGRPFLLRVESEEEGARFESADVVLDATGVFATPRSTGPGGLPAIGEERLGARIDRHPPAILGSARARYARRRVLLLGDGHSAATALAEFQELADAGEAASVTWVHPSTANGSDPFRTVASDPLPERQRLVTRANRIAREADWLVRHPGASVESYETWDGALRVLLTSPDRAVTDLEVDHVLALIGYRPDTSFTRELQIHHCYASEGPMALASAVLAETLASPGSDGDCLKQAAHGPEALRTPEPDFHVLGAKSYGRNPLFVMSLGHRQIEDAYALVEAGAAASREASAAPARGGRAG